MLETYEKHSQAKLIATLVAVLVVAGIVVLADHITSRPTARASQASTGDATMTPGANGTAAVDSTASTDSGSGTYKNGSYTASSDYFVPHGAENIQVSLNLQNGVIINASIQNSENDRTSASFQQEFATEYKSYVVGKKMNGLQLGVIAGASDTTQAFNDAIRQIASKAQG